MHRCNECGAEFNDVYNGRWGNTPIGYGWDPGMPKPCCGGEGPWEDAFWRSKTDKTWRPAKRRRPVIDEEGDEEDGENEEGSSDPLREQADPEAFAEAVESVIGDNPSQPTSGGRGTRRRRGIPTS